jgi:hypothetical protein
LGRRGGGESGAVKARRVRPDSWCIVSGRGASTVPEAWRRLLRKLSEVLARLRTTSAFWRSTVPVGAFQALPVIVLAGASRPLAQTDSERVVPSKRFTALVHIRSKPDADPERDGSRLGRVSRLVRSVPWWYKVQLSDSSTGFPSKAWPTIAHPSATRQQDELRLLPETSTQAPAH